MSVQFKAYNEYLEAFRLYLEHIEGHVLLEEAHTKNCDCDECEMKRREDREISEARKPKSGKSQPSSKDPVGEGGRFKALTKQLKKQGKSEESAKTIAASIGRKKFGKKKFQKMAAAGK